MANFVSTCLIVLIVTNIKSGLHGAQVTEETLGLTANDSLDLTPTDINIQDDTNPYTSPKPDPDAIPSSDMMYTIDVETEESLYADAEDPQELWFAHRMVWPWWQIIQLLSAIAGIVGNLLVILVIFRRQQKARRSTDTLIGALAIADFLTSVFLIPIPEVSNIPTGFLGEFYCKVIYTARFMWISVSASVFTLTAISVDRYVAINHPFKLRILFSSTRTRLAIVIVWIMAFILNSFAFFVFYVDPETQSCVLQFPTKNGAEVLGITSFIIVLILPVVVMLVTQSLTALALHRQSQRFKTEDGSAALSNARHLMAKRRVIQLIFIINVIFVISWGPNQSAYLAFNLGFLPLSYLYGPLDRALVVLAFFNSCANPLIYTMQYPKFRKAVRELFSKSRAKGAPIFDQPDNSPTPANSKAGNSTSLG